jgi:membrane protein YqaA with SNARE-associated domain
VGAAALLDSSTIPIPMDLILAGYVWNDKSHFWLYCLLAAAGSASRRPPALWAGPGGRRTLPAQARQPRALRADTRNRFENQEFLAMMIPSMLPPPTPWKAFVFAAGVFEMRVESPSCWPSSAAGMLRWLALSMLVLKLGPGAVDRWWRTTDWPCSTIVGGLAVAGFRLVVVPARSAQASWKTR